MAEGNLHQEIFRVAYDIYERSGRIEGRDLNNWLEAERTLRGIAGDDGGKIISVNIPMAKSDEEGEYSNWMIKFLKKAICKNEHMKAEIEAKEKLRRLKTKIPNL